MAGRFGLPYHFACSCGEVFSGGKLRSEEGKTLHFVGNRVGANFLWAKNQGLDFSSNPLIELW
jgi:hypothetical protein